MKNNIYTQKKRKPYGSKLGACGRNSEGVSTEVFSVYTTSKPAKKIPDRNVKNTHLRKSNRRKDVTGTPSVNNLISSAAGKLREKIASKTRVGENSSGRLSLNSGNRNLNIFNSFNSNRKSGCNADFQMINHRPSTLSSKSITKTPKRDYYNKIEKKFGNKSIKGQKTPVQKNSFKLHSKTKATKSSYNILRGSGLIRNEIDCSSIPPKSPRIAREDPQTVAFTIKIIDKENEDKGNTGSQNIYKSTQDKRKTLEQNCWYTENFEQSPMCNNHKLVREKRPSQVSESSLSSYSSVKKFRVPTFQDPKTNLIAKSNLCKEKNSQIKRKPENNQREGMCKKASSQQSGVSEKRTRSKRPRTRRKIKVIGIRASNL
ncbi:unnamed protein product [Moneuplotes crassus]|uniref:Uncharacterized protein n=1 Tax=Euplotes crassus TaxID=5936 RepID=A0AAD1XJ54_EUPCR|nr:unnamed protein product [Moneuplotes crassus]